MKVRGIRGATQLSSDDPAEMQLKVTELLGNLFHENALLSHDLISIFFTATPDIHSEFPAAAARSLNLGDVPLICAQELDIQGALPLTVRVMVHAHSELDRNEIKHIYLHGASVLRRDLAQ